MKIVLLIGGLILVLLLLTVIIFVDADCVALGENTNHETKWVFFGGGGNSCLIKINGQWTPTDVWVNNTGK